MGAVREIDGISEEGKMDMTVMMQVYYKNIDTFVDR